MTRRPVGVPTATGGHNAPRGWKGYVAARNAGLPAPRYRLGVWGSFRIRARRTQGLIVAAARILRHLPGHKLSRHRIAAEVPGVAPEVASGWRTYAGLPPLVVEGSARPLALLERIMMWGVV